MADDRLSCLSCGAPTAGVCRGCALAPYCSDACQRAGWARHRRYCETLRQFAVGALFGRAGGAVAMMNDNDNGGEGEGRKREPPGEPPEEAHRSTQRRRLAAVPQAERQAALQVLTAAQRNHEVRDRLVAVLAGGLARPGAASPLLMLSPYTLRDIAQMAMRMESAGARFGVCLSMHAGIEIMESRRGEAVLMNRIPALAPVPRAVAALPAADVVLWGSGSFSMAYCVYGDRDELLYRDQTPRTRGAFSPEWWMAVTPGHVALNAPGQTGDDSAITIYGRRPPWAPRTAQTLQQMRLHVIGSKILVEPDGGGNCQLVDPVSGAVSALPWGVGRHEQSKYVSLEFSSRFRMVIDASGRDVIVVRHVGPDGSVVGQVAHDVSVEQADYCRVASGIVYWRRRDTYSFFAPPMAGLPLPVTRTVTVSTPLPLELELFYMSNTLMFWEFERYGRDPPPPGELTFVTRDAAGNITVATAHLPKNPWRVLGLSAGAHRVGAWIVDEGDPPVHRLYVIDVLTGAVECVAGPYLGVDVMFLPIIEDLA